MACYLFIFLMNLQRKGYGKELRSLQKPVGLLSAMCPGSQAVSFEKEEQPTRTELLSSMM